MYIAAIAFLVGVICLQLIPQLPGSVWLWILVLVAILHVRSKCRIIPVFLLGFFWAWLQAANTLEARLPSEWEGKNLLVQGRVSAMPEQHTHGWRMRFAIERVFEKGAWIDFDLNVRLSWYQAASIPSAGESWQFRIRLKQPHGFANPGGFDYEGWLYRHGIRATGYIRKGSDNQRLEAASGYHVERLREHLNQQLNVLVLDDDNRALLKALVIGKRDGLSDEQWEILRRTGTGHLMAISGLHIGLVAGLVFMVTRRIWPLIPGDFSVHLPASRVAALLALSAAFTYAMIAGFSVPTQRALIMVAIVCLAQLPSRRSSLLQNMVVALLAVLTYDPATVLSPGFLLSFAAVGLIAYGRTGVVPFTRYHAGNIYALIRIQWQLSLGLLPLTILLFKQAAWLSPFANLLAVPWMSITVVPAAVAGTLTALLSTTVAEYVLGVAQGFLELVWRFLEWLASLPGSLWQHAPPPVWTWAPGVAGILLLLAPRGIPARWVGLVLLLPALSFRPERPATGDVWLTLLDVGQGLAAVVETSNHVLVFDTGPRWSEGFDAGHAVVGPFLVNRGWSNIDRLVISHGDNDHIGGARSLTDRLPVTDVLTSVPAAISWRKALPCHTEQAWDWDGVQFRVIHPPRQSEKTGNDRSCVLRVEPASEDSILLTGDIEREAEKWLVERVPDELKAAVLVAPHHGSQTSSTAEFIAAVMPDIVLIPAGYRNRFGFPHSEVVERYLRAGARIFDTGNGGAIQVEITAGEEPVPVTSFRETRRRFWYKETVPKRDRNPYDMHTWAR